MIIEKELIQGCINEEAKAQQALYELFASKMLGVCYRYCGNLEDAEDVMQEAFVKVFKSIHQYKFEGSFEGWLRRIMVNTALTFITRGKQFSQTIELSAAENLAYEPIETDAILHTKDIVETVKSLPTSFRLVINLYSIEGYSHREIADMLGIQESSSRSQYARARMLLARILNAKGRIQSIDNGPVNIN